MLRKLFTISSPCRYLVEGSQGSILHTGDFRAEPSFLESLTEDSFLKPFLAQGGNQTLDAIYLDTACVWSSSEPPSKVRFIASFGAYIDIFTVTESCHRRPCRPHGPLPAYNVLLHQCVDMGIRRYAHGHCCPLWRQGRFTYQRHASSLSRTPRSTWTGTNTACILIFRMKNCHE